MKKILYKYDKLRINSLVFKLVDYCDLGCNYCYREKSEYRSNKIMSDEIIDLTIDKYLEFCQNIHPQKEITLIWHGGEPLLAGIDKFKNILEIEEKYEKKYNIKIQNAIQSNGISLTSEMCELFSKNNFKIGFSIDGPKEIHDIHRKYLNEKSSFEKTIQGIELAKKYNLDANLIVVITNESYKNVKIIYNFIKSLKIKAVDFIPCFDYESDITLTEENYNYFLMNLFNLWKEDSFDFLEIRLFSDIFEKVYSLNRNQPLKALSCSLAGACGQNFSVGVNGDICTCECLTPVKEYFLGNIKEKSFELMLKEKSYTTTFKNDFNSVDKKCFDCDVFNICRGGCLNRRLPKYDKSLDIYCNPRKNIIKEIINFYHEKTYKYNE